MRINSKLIGLYVHIPFCNSKCYYCDFVSFANRNDYKEYVDALCRELQMRAGKVSDCVVSSIYFGGGTPSVLPINLFQKIVEVIKSNFNIINNCEFTVEVNPASATAGKFAEYKKLGVNRISVGLQSGNDAILKEIGRKHIAKDFVKTVKAIRKSGISNISADIMLGLPNQTMSDVDNTVRLLLDNGIEHISAYTLKIEKGTPFAQLYSKGKLKLPNEDTSVDMYDRVKFLLEEKEIYRYEISNFAKVGRECEHNINCWSWGRYLGVGVNAHSFVNDTRYNNVSTIDNYIAKVNDGKNPTSSRRKIDLLDGENEFIMLSLRLEQGLDIQAFNEYFCTDFVSRHKETLDKLERKGLIVYDKHYVNIKSDKMYICNLIMVEFMQ